MRWNRLVAVASVVSLIAGVAIVSQFAIATQATAERTSAQTIFDRFPPGRTMTVQLPAHAADELTDDGDEQLRDWLLYATLFDADIDARGLQQTLYDVPPVRSDHLRPIGGYAYGPMRWRRLPDGRVVVLVSGTDEEQRSQLGRAADEAVCDSDTVPRTFLVFAYDIAPSGTARLTRKNDVDGARLFSKEYGYVSTPIDSIENLHMLLDSTTRLTAVKVQDNAIIASGRLDSARPKRLITEADVAALWKSQKHVDNVAAQRESIQRKIEEFTTEWENKTYSTEDEKAVLEREYKREEARIKRLIESAPEGAVASGFSLDPAQDFAKLQKLFSGMRELFDEIAAEPGTGVNSATVKAAENALENKNPIPFFELVDKASNSGHPGAVFVGGIAQLLTQETQYQSARYDGLLQGTEVGMTLFYTDLLAKLWALDYEKSAPSADIVNFIPLLKTPINSAYVPELKTLPGTRVWFGPDDEGFQKNAKGVQFSGRTTRIYAASSNPLKPGEESQPNAVSAQFLGWWHDHYDRVAQFEPQYQRLDEIMKWSVAVSYVSSAGAIDSLQYLTGTTTEQQHWFPCWVKEHPELRFSKWETIEFFDERCRAIDREYPTETMPILQSDFYGGQLVSGGVSLGSRQAIKQKPVVSAKVPEALRRSGIDFASSNGKVLRTLSKTEYVLGESTERMATTTVKAPPAAKFRAVTAEFRPAEVVTRIEHAGDGLRTTTKVGDVDVATLAIAREGDALSVTLSRRDAARAHELLADLNADAPASLDAWAAKRADIATMIPTGKDTMLARLNGADRWIRIAREAEPSIDIPANVAMRAGRIGGGPERSWTIAFVREADAAKALDRSEYLVVKVPEKITDGVVIRTPARAPPDSGREVIAGGVRGVRAGNEIYVRRGDLPSGRPPDPALLRRLAQEIDIDRALNAAEQGRHADFTAESGRNPELYRTQLALMQAELERGIEVAVRNGDARNGLQLIARYAQHGGNVVRHMLNRAILLATADKPHAAVRALNEVAVTPETFDRAVSDINRLLAGDLGESTRASLLRLAEFIDLKRASGQDGGMRPVAMTREGVVDFHAELLDLQAQPVTGTSVPTAGTYVGADLPRGSTRIRTVGGVDQIAFDPNLVEAFKVENLALSLAEPSAIVDMKNGVRYRTAVRMKPAPQPYRPFNQRCPQDSDASSGQACSDDVYILRPRSVEGVATGA